MKRIPYGESNFELIRNKNFLYVDKTHFIEQLESTGKVIHLRPRRFGKSLFISVLQAYYDVATADKFDALFSGLHVHTHPTDYRNSYYVLRLNFSGIETKDFDMIMSGFFRRVKNDVSLFISKYQLNIDIDDCKTPAAILDTLLTGFEKLNLKHKIYVLIDEYDHFTNAVLNNGLDNFMELVRRGGLVRAFYETLKLKTEQGLIERFFITGVMSVSLDSMTSGFNIGTNITTEKRFSDLMGFTSDEVKTVLGTVMQNSQKEGVKLTDAEQAEVYEIWKQNYNGYLFSEESNFKVFNSTLIMYYLQKYVEEKEHPKSLVDPNLNQSSTTIEILAELKNSEANYEIIEEIVKEKKTSGQLSTFIDMSKKYDQDDFITLLFNIGLLTIKEGGSWTKFEIPNKIIETIYFQYLSELEQKRLGFKLDTRKQGRAIAEMADDGKIDQISHLVSEFLAHRSGRTDINLSEKEIQLIYLFIMSSTNQYFIYDEFPALRGYSDVVTLRTPGSYAKYEFLIELKYAKKGKKDETTNERVQKKLQEGIDQIAEYMKDKRLAERPNLKKFVVVFSGVEIVKLEEV